MKNLKISTRLSGAFALLVLMLVGLAVAAMAQLSSMRAATVEITENWLPSLGAENASTPAPVGHAPHRGGERH